MSSNESQSKGAFCVCHTTERSEHKLFINYVSDSNKDHSIKLPECLMKILKDPKAFGASEENTNIIKNRERLEIFIGTSLDARYGPKNPMIFMTEDEQDVVMNVYIHEDQLEALRQSPLKEDRSDHKLTVKRHFLILVLNAVQQRIVNIVGSSDLSSRDGWIVMPHLKMHLLDDNFKPQSHAKATKAQLLWIVKGPTAFETPEQAMERECSMLLPKSNPIKPGDHLFGLGCRDDDLGRSIYFNVTVSDHPQAIRLPPFVVDISKAPPAEARKMAASRNVSSINNMMSPQVCGCLERFHLQQEPQVFRAKDNSKNIVIRVPVHMSHAPLIGKSFLTPFYTMTLFMAMLMFYSNYFARKSQRLDLDINKSLRQLDGIIDQETGGRATDEDIYSILFKRKGTQKEADRELAHCDGVMDLIDERSMAL